MTKVKTRFSVPCDVLHLSQARIALLNYNFAKQYDGTFFLRVDGNPETNLDCLKWLGVSWQEEIKRIDRLKHYREFAEKLIKDGLAYPDIHSGQYRHVSPSVALQLWDDTGWALRFKIEESVVLDDLTKGQISWNKKLEDPVILRIDGTATYDFAVAVDDGEMGVTHVICSEEELDKTPAQILIQHALGFVPPFYSHVPQIKSPRTFDKEVLIKLSKIGFSDYEATSRDELHPAAISLFFCLGYEPKALSQYLTTYDEFDSEELLRLAAKYTKDHNTETVTQRCTEFLINAKIIKSPPTKGVLSGIREIIELCGDGIRIYSDILTRAAFFFEDPEEVKVEKDEKGILDPFLQLLVYNKNWAAYVLDSMMESFSALRYLGNDHLQKILRRVLTGFASGPKDIGSVMVVLGKETCLRRIRNALKCS